jgi:hypothetical protein
VISQLQTRGVTGGLDEFVELYNPGSAPVTFDSSWSFQVRNASSGLSGCAAANYATRFSGTGQVIPPHGHILFVNTSGNYSETTAPDGMYSMSFGISDAGSAVLYHGSVVVDALCFYFDSNTLSALTGCSTPYTCAGMPVMNPHNNTTSTASNTDASLERLPGGAGGNTMNTGDNASDFIVNATPDPHDLASTPVP